MTDGANRLTSRATLANPQSLTTPAGQFRAQVDAFAGLGYDVDRLLTGIGIRRAELDEPDALVPCEACGAFFARALDERPLKNLGVRLAAETPLGAFPLLDYLVLTCDTVGEGFAQLARHVRLTGAPFVLELRDEEDPVRVVYLCDSPAAHWGIEYSVTLSVLHFRKETEHRVRFTCASFTHEPDDVSEIEAVLGCSVRSRAAWAGLELPREGWQALLRRRDPILRSILEAQADAVAPRQPAPDPLLADVRRVLSARLARGEMAIDLVARDLAMSARTLQRRLSVAGLSYQEVLDSSRRDTAEKCLTRSSLSIAEVAYLLGYSEPAAFHRAFKRWTGVTPQAFRRDRREAGVLAAHGHQPGGLEPRSGNTRSRP